MRLNQITAAATDLDASIAFYQALGLRLIVKSPHYARFELPEGEATFSLHVTDGAIPRDNAPHLYFEVLDVDFEVSRMRHAGYEIEAEPSLDARSRRQPHLHLQRRRQSPLPALAHR